MICATESNHLLSAILIFHAPNRVKEAFYYQMSNVYALLVTCFIFLLQRAITRFHATVAIFIASSPVSIYFLVYSLRSCLGYFKTFRTKHRLDTVLGRGQRSNLALVFFAAGIWISIVVYTSLESTRSHFAQESCSAEPIQKIFVKYVVNLKWLGLAMLLSPWVDLTIVAAFSWFVSIWLARKEIWLPGEGYLLERPVIVW